MFVDSHAHLDGPEFDGDRDAVIERARKAGLRYLLVIGGASGLEQIGAALDIAEGHDWIHAAAGIDPHEASKAHDGAGIGAAMGELKARDLASQAGFSHFRKLPIDDPFSVLYELRP